MPPVSGFLFWHSSPVLLALQTGLDAYATSSFLGMDSLLANYASSDEEEQEQPQRPISAPAGSSRPSSRHGESTSSKTSSLFSSLPQPNSPSLFQSLPQPKQTSKTENALIGEDGDEEDDLEPGTNLSKSTSKSSSIFSSLPQPKRSSINPSPAAAPLIVNDDTDNYEGDSNSTSRFIGSASLFSSLPKPKSQIPQQPVTGVSSSGPSAKKVVQFKPPIIPLTKSSELDDDDDEDDIEQEQNRRKKLDSVTQTSSVKSFLSSIPAPRNSTTLGVQTTSGSGRRSILETDAPATNADVAAVENNVPVDQNAGNYVNYDSYANYQFGTDQNLGYYTDNASYNNYSSGVDQSVGVQPDAGTAGTATSYYGSSDAYASYSTYGDYGQYVNNWVDGSAATAPEVSGMHDNTVKLSGKRGRTEIPSEVIEVKQEELIKNPPREDQVMLTGIAFGPAYQPVSAKGKPTKLHKRKHQIGSLYYDMKQKEMELTERRAKGMLTKAETQAKYGW